MQTEADTGIGPVSCKNCSVFKKGEGGPEAPGALRLRNKKATASVASSYSENTPVFWSLTSESAQLAGVKLEAKKGRYTGFIGDRTDGIVGKRILQKRADTPALSQ